ncbi:ComF family protein, partial [bacterium]|nr:ComF family protein [bacterium]
LTRKERMKNLDSAFKINIESYNDKPLLILDDICTTGATFESVVEQLKKHNITKITCFATSTPLGGAK